MYKEYYLQFYQFFVHFQVFHFLVILTKSTPIVLKKFVVKEFSYWLDYTIILYI